MRSRARAATHSAAATAYRSRDELGLAHGVAGVAPPRRSRPRLVARGLRTGSRRPPSRSATAPDRPRVQSASISAAVVERRARQAAAQPARWRAWRSASSSAASIEVLVAKTARICELRHRPPDDTVDPMPKTLDGSRARSSTTRPARDSELFLVDGNNLAYRAFFALPEELATSEGFPTNALLGFTNMLFKLLSDYRPKGVAVAWDTRPVHRAAVAESGDVVYKEGRRPMPDLLREQFPHFRPIVEAFGYRNLEFEGWEADDVIATLATRADEAGIRTCVVSTDRDAFQLVTENVTLMMTPRGVARRQRLHARARRGALRDPARPDPGLHRAQGRHLGQHPGRSGDRRQDRRAADRAVRVARGGDRARRRALAGARKNDHRARRPGARRRRSSRRCAATSSSSATRPRSCSRRRTARSCARCSGASSSANLLNRVDELDEAVPAAPMQVDGDADAVARGADAAGERRAGRRWRSTGTESPSRPAAEWSSSRRRPVQGSRASGRARRQGAARRAEGRHDARRVPDRAGPAEYELDDLAAEYGVEVEPEPEADEETAALVGRRGDAPAGAADASAVRERDSERLYRDVELPLTRCSPRWRTPA